MTSIPPQVDQYLQELVARGRFRSEEDALFEAVRLLRDHSEEPTKDVLLPTDEWLEWFDKVTAGFTGGNPTADYSRDSIYGDDGR